SKIKAVETGCSIGTVMDVRDLFFNVPARLKFLKRATTEIGHIQEIVQSLALSYPQIAFELKFGGSTKLKTSGCADLLRSIVETKLVKDEANLCKIELNDTVAGVSVYGYAARPTQFRGDRKGILTFVNGRPVRCPLTLKALDYAYSDLIPRGKYPLAVVSIELPQNEIDVNIHPTKKEIKYSNSHNVYTTLHRAIGNALREPRKELVEAMAARGQREEYAEEHFEPASSSVATASYNPLRARERDSYSVRESQEWNYDSPKKERIETEQLSFAEELSYSPAFVPEVREVPEPQEDTGTTINSISTCEESQLFIEEQEEISLPAGWRLAGYLHNTYYLFETRDGIELIEQHIAHERYLYEKLLAAQKTRGRTSEHNQQLCISIPLELTSTQTDVLKGCREALTSLGFEFEIDESDNVSCTQVPIQMAHQNYATIIQTLLDDLESTDAANISLDATKSIACQSAIKNGMPLSERDILRLVSAWLKTERH
ncbi:MAG TPA: DNA mismatch repair endonuclease MutL, partial [Candidatus Melainabacteria bacterium]|nr:DNA mismatch repair endonuclease MutL [Candidatus Melainabacteria bacterium]